MEQSTHRVRATTRQEDMRGEAAVERKSYDVRTGLLLVPPCAVIVLSCMVWVTALSQSGFWADDFLWVTHFARSLGDVTDYHFNIGKYTINVFWALGTEVFGDGSVLPFLLMNMLVFAVGLITWLQVGVRRQWNYIDAWWVGGIFIATGAWLPTVLWASNITHAGGFLALGVAMSAHYRAMDAHDVRHVRCWSVLGGIAWMGAVASNLIYVGFLVLAVYCAVYQYRKLLCLEVETMVASTVWIWNLVLPIVYFIVIGYPGATASSPYAKTGLQFIRENLHFYRMALAPNAILVIVYVALILAGVIGGIFSARRRNFFPLAVLVAAGAMALPALVQSQQRYVNYMAMSLLLLFSAVASGLVPAFRIGSERRTYMVVGGSLVALVLIFHQGDELRSYFTRTPYGSDLARFRSEVASLTPEDGNICATLNLDTQQESLFIAEISGENGFRVPPIDAEHAILVPRETSCPPGASVTHIRISVNQRNGFVAK